MKIRATSPAILFSLLFLLLLYPYSFIAEAQPTAKIPAFVLKSSGGAVMGQVVGYEKLGEILLVMDDPGFSNDIPLNLIIKDGNFVFDGPEGRVYYTGGSCDGTAYVQQASTSGHALSRVLGRSYAVGPTPGGTDVKVYRGQATPPGSPPTIQSRFSGGSCVGGGSFGEVMVVADSIIDITSLFGNSGYTME